MKSKNQKPIYIAIFHPLNILMLVATVTASMCSAWWFLPLGIIIWAVMVLIIIKDPLLNIQYVVDSRTPLAQRYEKKFKAIERLQVKIFAIYLDPNRRLYNEFNQISVPLNKLMEQIYQICHSASGLENYRLVGKGKIDSENEWVLLSEQIEFATDDYIKEELIDARNALEKKFKNERDVDAYLNRLDALLIGIQSDLEEVLSIALTINPSNPQSNARFVREKIFK